MRPAASGLRPGGQGKAAIRGGFCGDSPGQHDWSGVRREKPGHPGKRQVQDQEKAHAGAMGHWYPGGLRWRLAGWKAGRCR